MIKNFTLNRILTALPIFLLSILLGCQNLIDTPQLSCPSMKMSVTLQAITKNMQLNSNVIFKVHTDSGGIKYLSTEALCDSFKILFNLKDGMFSEQGMQNDSFHLQTYPFLKGKIDGGLVVIAMATDQGYNFLETDTSSITITRMNLKSQTLSGYFYFEAGNGEVTGNGTFESACYVSME